jgi:hypothetical protein
MALKTRCGKAGNALPRPCRKAMLKVLLQAVADNGDGEAGVLEPVGVM